MPCANINKRARTDPAAATNVCFRFHPCTVPLTLKIYFLSVTNFLHLFCNPLKIPPETKLPFHNKRTQRPLGIMLILAFNPLCLLGIANGKLQPEKGVLGQESREWDRPSHEHLNLRSFKTSSNSVPTHELYRIPSEIKVPDEKLVTAVAEGKFWESRATNVLGSRRLNTDGKTPPFLSPNIRVLCITGTRSIRTISL